MTTTAPLQPPLTTAPLDLPTVSFFGRTLDEYRRFFALDPVQLRGRAVLDVAAGPASFTAEVRRYGVDAVAVDPFYDRPVADLAAQVRADYTRMFAQIRAKPSLFRLKKAFRSLEAAEADRRAAAQRFLCDYEGNVRHGRYVRGALPHLPFLDGAFDLVLCAHLLFVYAARFDPAWHLAACLELARVSAGEVRIHPVCGPNGRRYPQLDELRRGLEAQGLASELRRVDYEFFAGSTSTLVLQRTAAPVAVAA